MAKKAFERLSTKICPHRYHLELKPCFKTLTFTGKLKIDIEEGKSVLDLTYSGAVSDRMEGFYKSTYTSEGVDKVMLVTHFEPVETKVEQNEGLVAYTFQDTPKMSSYLVAFAIGDLEYVEDRDKNGVLVRVYSRKGYVSEKEQGQFALETACKSLPFFGDYFDIKYPLPKVDLLAIPDFPAGAMENWGLVTFRERTLLVEKLTASASTKEGVALTVSHELAHMWFGNLVTMEWWTDLWLKEGFATWIEYLCVNHCYPEMKIWTHFTYYELTSALSLDAQLTSHPIEVEVSSPDEIDEIFDTISYRKGASLINMMHNYLGETNFKLGLQTYQKKFAYGNARSADLSKVLQDVSGVDMISLMRNWTGLAGFPVLSVTPVELAATGGNKLSVKLSQSVFTLPPSKPKDQHTWQVPVVLTCSSLDGQHSTSFKHVLRVPEELITIDLPWSPESLDNCLVHANRDASGFYHTRYSTQQFDALIKRIATPSEFSVSSRIVFINDAVSLVKAGCFPVSDWLRLVPDFLRNETAYPVWHCVLSDGLSQYTRRLLQEANKSTDTYNTFVRQLTIPVLQQMGFFRAKPADYAKLSHNDALLLARLIATAGAQAGDRQVIDQAKLWFVDHCAGKQVVPNDLRSAIYTTAVRHADSPAVIDTLMQHYRISKSPEEQSAILCALGAAPSTTTGQGEPTSPLDRVIAFSLDRQGQVRNQDKLSGLIAAASWSPEARLITWQAIKRDWDYLRDIYRGPFLLGSLIKGVLSNCVRKEETSEIKAFFQANPVPCLRAVDQLVEKLDTNHALFQRDTEAIAATLDLMVNKSNGAVKQ